MKAELTVDPAREEERDRRIVGIYVRAKYASGKWGSVDISQLDRESLIAWLTSREGLAVNVVLGLCGHVPEQLP